jgi:hypothetical protein
MTEPKPEIAPRIVNGEPTCSGEACPAFKETTGMNDECFAEMAFGEWINEGDDCIPGLRRQRDERTEERDAARRVVCEQVDCLTGHCTTAEQYAEANNWSYLYETPEGGEG